MTGVMIYRSLNIVDFQLFSGPKRVKAEADDQQHTKCDLRLRGTLAHNQRKLTIGEHFSLCHNF